MSIINFKCSSEEKDEVKNIFCAILKEHYLNTVFPNTKVEYINEGKEIYASRMDELIKTNLCKIKDVKNGIQIEFDSTEDAGFLIADAIYGTNMGYSDEGLTYLKPIFDSLIEQLPNICFEAECECYDKWISEEYSCYYDGESFECNAEWMYEEE